jgi:HK97 family phage portal protein
MKLGQRIALRAASLLLGRDLSLTSERLTQWFGGGPTSSGETVSVQTALQLEVVWAATRLVAGTVATLPCQLFKRDAAGRGTLNRNHPLYVLLHDQPNSDMTAVVFWEAVVACLLLWGNAYILIDRAFGGRVSSLTPLQPDRIKAVERQADGSLLYRYEHSGVKIEFKDTELMHVKGFSTDGIVGLSPVAQARETLGLAQAAERSAASIFRNGMRTPFAFVLPAFLSEIQRKRFEDEWLPKYTGAINAGKTPFLEGGWKIESIGMNPADVQLLSTRTFAIEQICRWFGVQPVMIGHMEKSTAWGTGLEQMNLWFLTYTLRPLLKAIEQEIARSLLTPVERQNYYAEFNVEGLLRADSAGRAALLKVLAESGLRTRNELRALDNMPPLPGGDDLTVNSATVPLRLLGQNAMPIPAGVTLPAANENQGAA